MSITRRLDRLEATLDELDADGSDRDRVECWGQPDPAEDRYIRSDGVTATRAEIPSLPRPPHRQLVIRTYVSVTPPTIEGQHKVCPFAERPEEGTAG
jgi:hypothetical protein